MGSKYSLKQNGDDFELYIGGQKIATFKSTGLYDKNAAEILSGGGEAAILSNRGFKNYMVGEAFAMVEDGVLENLLGSSEITNWTDDSTNGSVSDSSSADDFYSIGFSTNDGAGAREARIYRTVGDFDGKTILGEIGIWLSNMTGSVENSFQVVIQSSTKYFHFRISTDGVDIKNSSGNWANIISTAIPIETLVFVQFSLDFSANTMTNFNLLVDGATHNYSPDTALPSISGSTGRIDLITRAEDGEQSAYAYLCYFNLGDSETGYATKRNVFGGKMTRGDFQFKRIIQGDNMLIEELGEAIRFSSTASGGGGTSGIPSYIHGSMNDDQVAAVGDPIEFNVTLSSSGLSLSGYRITLEAGKTYWLEGVLRISQGQSILYQWYDVTAAEHIGIAGTQMAIGHTTYGNYSTSEIAGAYITPSVETEVELRLTYTLETNNIVSYAYASWFRAQEIIGASSGAPDCSFFELSADQTSNLSANDPIEFDIASEESGISWDTVNYKATLTAGKKYHLNAALLFDFSQTSGAAASVRWYNLTTSEFIGKGAALNRSSFSYGNQTTAQCIFTPSVNTEVQLRIEEGAYLQKFHKDFCLGWIKEIK